MYNSRQPQYLIGVGASAGGLEALSQLFANINEPLENAAFIVAQHVSASHKSMLVQLLSKNSTVEIQELKDKHELCSRIVYVTPPGYDVTVKDGIAHLGETEGAYGPRPNVDNLFDSIAEEYKDKSIAIVLSGTGSDGAKGVAKIHAHGGYVLVQNPRSAKYDGMPLSAIQTNYVDFVKEPSEMGKVVSKIVHSKEGDVIRDEQKEESEVSETDASDSLTRIFKHLNNRKGTDFFNYKSSTIHRRIEKRMSYIGINSMDEYARYMDEHSEEADKLFNEMLIGFTTFFRDPEVFEQLEKYLKNLLRDKAQGDSIRAWVPGCATGEESYTLAIMLNELLGENLRRFDVQVFATDIDDKALKTARKGIFSSKALENISNEIREKYFKQLSDGSYEVDSGIRDLVLFSRHDITNHPPFLRLDLISCRNLLIYFNSELQDQVIPVFHYGLRKDGILLLGKSESIKDYSDLFSTLDSPNNIFYRKPVPGYRNLKFRGFRPISLKSGDTETKQETDNRSFQDIVKNVLFQKFEHPFVIVDDQMNVVETHGEVAPFLGVSTGSVNNNIYKMINDELNIELRTTMSKVQKANKDEKSRYKKYTYYNNDYLVRLNIKPFYISALNHSYYFIIFEKEDFDENYMVYSSATANGDKPAGSEENDRIAELERELAATKEHLQTYIEELETSNEEMQSLNEELQSTNEELQSSNEELETSNEELQSTLEEMQIAYSELNQAKEELEHKDHALRSSQANIEALLGNTLQSFVLLDSNFEIITFNEQALHYSEHLFDQRLKIGQSIVNYIPEAYLAQFKKEMNKTFTGEICEGIWDRVEKENRSYSFKYNLTPVKVDNQRIDTLSFSLLDITEQEHIKRQLSEREELISSVFNIADIGICVTDHKGRITEVNKGYLDIVNGSEQELLGDYFSNMVIPEERQAIKQVHGMFIAGQEDDFSGEYKFQRKDGTIIDVLISAALLKRDNGENLSVTTVKDITESKRLENLLKETQHAVMVGGWEYDVLNNNLLLTDEVYDILDVPVNTGIPNTFIGKYVRSEYQEELSQNIKDSIKEASSFELDVQAVTERQNNKWVRIGCKPVSTGEKTIKLMGFVQDITDMRRSQGEIHKLSMVAHSIHNGIIIADHNNNVEWVNEGFGSMTGYGYQEVVGQPVDKILNHSLPENGANGGSDSQWLQKWEDPEIKEWEVNLHTKEDNILSVLMNRSFIEDSQNEASNTIVLLTDMTRQKEDQVKIEKSLLEKEVLLKEIHHRVKNNLAVITSLFQLHAQEVEDKELQEALFDGEARIRSMAMVHEKLYGSGNLSEIHLNDYLEDFLYSIRDSYPKDLSSVEIKLDLEDVQLDIMRAIPLGLIVNELVVNAFKHAFDKGDSGSISVTLKSMENGLELKIADTGPGWPDGFSFEEIDSLGVSLIKTLIDQIDAEMEFWNSNGANFQLKLYNS